MLTLKPSLPSSGRWSGAWWIKLPGRMSSRTRWWYQTWMSQGKCLPPLPQSAATALSFHLVWAPDLPVGCPASPGNLGSHWIDLGLTLTVPWLVTYYRAEGRSSHPCWSLGHSPASVPQTTLQQKLQDSDKIRDLLAKIPISDVLYLSFFNIFDITNRDCNLLHRQFPLGMSKWGQGPATPCVAHASRKRSIINQFQGHHPGHTHSHAQSWLLQF